MTTPPLDTMLAVLLDRLGGEATIMLSDVAELETRRPNDQIAFAHVDGPSDPAHGETGDHGVKLTLRQPTANEAFEMLLQTLVERIADDSGGTIRAYRLTRE